MKKSELVNFLNQVYNFQNCELWDFCGTRNCDQLHQDITGVMVALDITDSLINDAIFKSCNVIITHHPILFETEKEDLGINLINRNFLNKLSKLNIMHISLHTCYDRHPNGTSYQIFKLLSQHLDILFIRQEEYLVFAKLLKPLKFGEFIHKLTNISQITGVRTFNYSDNNSFVEKICIGAGSCSSMMNNVINYSDCFLTGDVKWHGYLDALNSGLKIIDINHDTENVFIFDIVNLLSLTFPNLKIFYFSEHKIINYK